MAKNLTPAQIVAKWKAGVSAGAAQWNAGIQRTLKNPMNLASAQQGKFQANFLAAVPRWTNIMANYPVADWKAACALQQAKYAIGAVKGERKYTNFANKAAPVWLAMKAASVAAGVNPIARVSAALDVLIRAGRKSGGVAFS